jgi:hypothetical protein
MLLPEFAGSGAERNAFRMREIRSRPFSLGRGVSRGGEDILFLRHWRIGCVCRMARKLVDLRFIADIGSATNVLRKCRAGRKQAEHEQGRFHSQGLQTIEEARDHPRTNRRMLAPPGIGEASPVPNFAGVKWRLFGGLAKAVAIVCTVERAPGDRREAEIRTATALKFMFSIRFSGTHLEPGLRWGTNGFPIVPGGSGLLNEPHVLVTVGSRR